MGEVALYLSATSLVISGVSVILASIALAIAVKNKADIQTKMNKWQ